VTRSVLYLKLPNGAQLPISVTLIDDGLLIQGLDQIELCFEVIGLASLQRLLRPAVRTQPAADPLTLSPVDVVAYFEQSPILCIYADDLRTAVLSHSKADQSVLQLQNDLQAVADLVSPTQADIAERLFGSREKTGGSYRKRILAVLGATTTSNEAGPAGRREGKAA